MNKLDTNCMTKDTSDFGKCVDHNYGRCSCYDGLTIGQINDIVQDGLK